MRTLVIVALWWLALAAAVEPELAAACVAADDGLGHACDEAEVEHIEGTDYMDLRMELLQMKLDHTGSHRASSSSAAGVGSRLADRDADHGDAAAETQQQQGFRHEGDELEEEMRLTTEHNKSWSISGTPNDICYSAVMANCKMFHSTLVVVPEVKDLPGRTFSWLSDRKPYCSTRVKHNATQLGEKLRTETKEGRSAKFDQPLIVPVACTSKPAETVLEFSFKDSPQGVRFWSEQLSQMTVPIAQFQDEEGTIPKKEGDTEMKVTYEWCAPGDSNCLHKLSGGKEVVHTGVDCQSSCHYAIRTIGMKAVDNALKFLAEAKKAYQDEKTPGDQKQEEVDKYEAPKKKAWDSMRMSIHQIPEALIMSCAGMPPLPSIPIKVKAHYSTQQVGQIESYLNTVKQDLSAVADCLQMRWFKGEYALTRQAMSVGTCPVSLP